MILIGIDIIGTNLSQNSFEGQNGETNYICIIEINLQPVFRLKAAVNY